MSQLRLILLLSALSVGSSQVQAQTATTDWNAGSPSAGGISGSIATSVWWANCTGASKVIVKVYKTVGGAQQEVKSATLTNVLTSGTWGNLLMGIASGTVITSADVQVLDANNQILAAKFKEMISVTVP